MKTPPRVLRITTAPISLKVLLKGQLGFFQQQGFSVLAVSAAGSEVTAIQSQNIPHRVIPMTRSITPLQDLVCLIKLIRLMIAYKPHIVHTHTPKAGLLGMLAAFLCRVPIRIHTIAGLPLMESAGVKKRVLKVTEQITYACAHRLYPNSNGLLAYIKNEFNLSVTSFEKKDAAKFKVIGRGSSNGIDSHYFSRTAELVDTALNLRIKYGIPKETLVFGFVGRIVADKGIVELVEAFKQFLITMDARLLLIGEWEQHLDPLPEEILGFIQKNPKVIVPGYQQDVRPWLMVADVFTFPSYREGFPNAVMQACCLEIPCIVSDINGCNEIIENNNNGLLVPPKNTEALLKAMRTLAANSALRNNFAKKAHTYMVANFDQQYVWNELLFEYHELLNKNVANGD
jgi:glycosyltransferase involved in cell wall biosynthesis